MKKRHIIILALASIPATLSADNATPDSIRAVQEKFGFTIVKDNPATPVKDQAASGTCWDYAGISFVESEMLRAGKEPADLSEMFVVYHAYLDKARKYVRMHGNIAFSPGGEGNDVLDVIRRYGIVPLEAYPGLTDDELKNDHNALHRELYRYLKDITASKTIRGDWESGFKGILERYLGVLPEKFAYQGKEYTPRSFADQVVDIRPDDYVYLTSWTDKPFYGKMQLLVPDNWSWAEYHNLPLNEMISALDYALEQGYTVIWAADMSEKGFSVPLGIAIVPEGYDSLLRYGTKDEIKQAEIRMFDGIQPEKTITQTMRQRGFDDYSTVDDHSMHITGTARDGNGKKYYVVKNSWGTDRGFDGIYYASEAFVRYKTIALILNKGGVPPVMAKKLK